VDGLARLLTDDVVLQMPPVLNWYVGRARYAAFIRRIFTLRGTQWRALAISANGRPALAAYALTADGTHQAHTLQVFTTTSGGISSNVVFAEPDLFSTFGLPLTL